MRINQLKESPDQDELERLARAKSMGFDTTTVWYHATNNVFSQFDITAKKNNRSNNVAGFYLNKNKNQIEDYGSIVMPLYIRMGKVWNRLGGNNISGEMLRVYRAELIDNGYQDNDWTTGMVDHFEETQIMKVSLTGESKRNVLIAGGYDTYLDGVGRDEEGTLHIGDICVLHSRNMRSIDAKFNIAARMSGNLMS